MIKTNSIGSYFQAQLNKPAHLSVGAVLYDPVSKKYVVLYKKTDKGRIHTFPAKTITEKETLEEAFHRCIKSELGAKARIITYVGSKQSEDIWFAEVKKPTTVQKTTIMFLGELTKHNGSQRATGEFTEDDSPIKYLPYKKLLKLFQSEYREFGHEFFNFAAILEVAEKIRMRR